MPDFRRISANIDTTASLHCDLPGDEAPHHQGLRLVVGSALVGAPMLSSPSLLRVPFWRNRGPLFHLQDWAPALTRLPWGPVFAPCSAAGLPMASPVPSLGTHQHFRCFSSGPFRSELCVGLCGFPLFTSLSAGCLPFTFPAAVLEGIECFEITNVGPRSYTSPPGSGANSMPLA